MANNPYIPLYIGDWERDTNLLTPLAEFALLKLTFKLFSSEKKGVFYANFRTLSVLFKSDLATTKDIFQELIDNKILDILEVSDGKFEIKSRRMIRESNISEIRAEAGKKGGEAKSKQKSGKNKAKHKQNTDIDNDIDYDNDIDIIYSISENFQKIFDRWLKYKAGRKQSYKTDDSKNTALRKLIKFSGGDETIANEIIDSAIGNNYSGFFEIKKVPEQTKRTLQY